MQPETQSIVNIAAYKFVELSGLDELRAELSHLCEAIAIKCVAADNSNVKFGLIADESIRKAKVTSAGFEFDAASPNLQHVGDFEVRIV